jgi:hypothetical protein
VTDRLHPFLTFDAEPDERADLGAGLDRLVLRELLGCASWPSPGSATACPDVYHPFRATTLPPSQQILQKRHAARLTLLRGRRDVTGGWEETLACLSGRCADACRAPLLMMGITRRVRREKAEMTSDDAMRASDGDREHAAEMLRNAYAAGRIDLEELHGRADAAYSAKTWGELRDLTADLPAGQVLSCAASGAESPAGVAQPGHAPRRPRAAIWVTVVIWLTIAAAAHTAAAIPLVLLSLFLLRAASARGADASLSAVGQAEHPVLRARRSAAYGVHRPGGSTGGRRRPAVRCCAAESARRRSRRPGARPGPRRRVTPVPAGVPVGARACAAPINGSTGRSWQAADPGRDELPVRWIFPASSSVCRLGR